VGLCSLATGWENIVWNCATSQGGELDAAKSDLQTLLSLEPENQDAARELTRVASAIERQSRLEAHVFRDVLK
jgi:Tfp pilus assembly protein PilF